LPSIERAPRGALVLSLSRLLLRRVFAQANFVYVIHDAETGEAATVDAAWDTDGILRFVASLGASVTAALYTHRHEDHVGGRSPRSGNLRAGAVNMAAAGATVYCMDADADSVERSTEALVTRLADGGTVQLGAHTITAIATPGHTPGSCCYLAGTAGGTLESEVVFTGDTLFGTLRLTLHPPPQIVCAFRTDGSTWHRTRRCLLVCSGWLRKDVDRGRDGGC
jgi:glyoxylase-like metal-dependent hydrolase (beta-lactamase superfamily II)